MLSLNEWWPVLLIALLIVIIMVLYFTGFRIVIQKRQDDRKPIADQAGFDTAGNISIDNSSPLMAQVFSGLDEGILVVDRDNRVPFINHAARIIFEYTQVKASEFSFIEVVRDYEFVVLLQKCRSSGITQAGLIDTRQGKKLLRVTISPVQGAQDCTVVVYDITDRRKLENIRRDFISNISHELRTPIASIRALAETLEEGAVKDQEVASNFVRLIGIEADRLTQMVNDLNDLTRIDEGASSLDKVSADLNELISQSTERLKSQADRRRIEIISVVENGLPQPVIDRSRIEQVLLNLIHNAIKFTGNGGSITVHAGQSDECILVSVRDTGIGIPADDLSRVFERFYKVDKSRSGEGSGIGLAICKNIITSHGGKIWAESELGKGTTFFFTLPL